MNPRNSQAKVFILFSYKQRQAPPGVVEKIIRAPEGFAVFFPETLHAVRNTTFYGL